MKWLYKFLVKVIDNGWCAKMGCSTCGSLEFRATLISNLNCYKIIPEITKISEYKEGHLISPVYDKLDMNVKKKIVEEISDEFKGLSKAQVDHLGPPGSGILSSVFYEFSDQSDYLHSLIIGSPAGAHLKAMMVHYKGHR
jgi:hypothetical protein|tara:strand:+ start:66 stop:485 length:420 start_codon:yes stop_codon:yes gene_type:complete